MNLRKTLRQGLVPKAIYDPPAPVPNAPNGTKITVWGYNDNIQASLSHEEMKDFIYWFTRFGSFERELEIESHKDNIILLQGLGWSETSPEPLKFGHPFPQVQTDIRTLKATDRVYPLDYYVTKWYYKDVSVNGVPGSKIDFVFYIEGDAAKRTYNKMLSQLHSRFKKTGQYRVEERNGLWFLQGLHPC